MYIRSEQRLNKVYRVEAEPVSFHNNDEIIKEGERLAVISGCTDCHGEDLGGNVVISDSAFDTTFATNPTSGVDDIGNDCSEGELLQVIRHGSAT